MMTRSSFRAVICCTIVVTWTVGALHLATAASARSRTRPNTARRTALFAHDWNGYASRRTLSGWKRAAKRHTMLIGPGGPVYGERIRRLHSWNPRLSVLVYDVGPYTVAGTHLYRRLLARHPGYFARDSKGNLITVVASGGSPAFPRNTLMDPGNPGWRRVMARRVRSEIRRYGFDGAYIDSTGQGPMTGTTTAAPINRATGSPYTASAWFQQEAKMLNRIRGAIGRKFLFCTGLVKGYSYRDVTHILARSKVNGVMTDSWLRLSSSSVGTYPSVDLFRANLRMVQDLQARGKYFFGWTKVWTSATDAQRHAWDRFALASYLLVKARKALYAFTPAFSVDRTLVYDRMQVARLGRALGPYTVSNGTFRRRFAHGRVIVNPAAHTASIIVS